MRVNASQLPIRLVTGKKQPAGRPKEIIATGTGISVRSKGAPFHSVGKNNPNDPLVSKKILDSLDLGLINFDQRERDTIAKILVGRAQEAKK